MKEGVESQIVQLADQAEQAAYKRMQAEYNSPLTPAVVMLTDQERTVLDAKDELVQKYQGTYGTEVDIHLLPYMSSYSPVSPFSAPISPVPDQDLFFPVSAIVAAEEKKPSAMELEDKVLETCTLIHVGSDVYVYDSAV